MATRKVIVVGAGIFGASIAERLSRTDWDVTLVDRDGPGNARATSSSHSRVIRCGHGDERFYTELAWRAIALWRELEAEADEELLIQSGVLWLARGADGWETASRPTMEELGIPVRVLDPEEVSRVYPSVRTDDLAFGLLEPESGTLFARKGVEVLAGLAADRGAHTLRAEAIPTATGGVRVDGEELTADRVVWACGPWLDRLFGDLVDLRVTRREYVTFQAGPGWDGREVPVFYDFEGPVYGMGDIDGHGLKVAPDKATEDYDPDTVDRPLTAAAEAEARAYLAHRFPALAEAPRAGGRVCQYELTADNQFVLAPHPGDERVWLVGGGSGHGYKHGPALGELVGELLEGKRAPLPQHALGPREPAPGLRSAAVDFAA